MYADGHSEPMYVPRTLAVGDNQGCQKDRVVGNCGDYIGLRGMYIMRNDC
jgi:hypothetical protein